MVYTILNFKHLGIIAWAIKHQIYEIPLFSFNRASDFAFLAMSECFSFYDNLFLSHCKNFMYLSYNHCEYECVPGFLKL